MPSNPDSVPEHVLLERLHPDASLPERATAGSAGADLRAYLRGRTVRRSDGSAHGEMSANEEAGEWGILVQPGEMVLVPLGFRSRLPLGVEAQIRPRSGQVLKRALTVPNSPGTIDADYAEEWMVILRNEGRTPQRIVHGERIAQVVFARYESLPMVEGAVSRTTDRAGGFGSTGTA